jgi:hypothetical protein
VEKLILENPENTIEYKTLALASMSTIKQLETDMIKATPLSANEQENTTLNDHPIVLEAIKHRNEHRDIKYHCEYVETALLL